jgi:tetratricopeptide (TPR) repeat protein
MFPLLAQTKEALNLQLKQLDHAIDSMEIYDARKEERIAALKKQLAFQTSPDSIHRLYNELYTEYEAFVFDSAMYYVRAHLNISIEQNNIYWINYCKMKLARMYSTFARFTDAVELFYSIKKEDLNAENLAAYYNGLAEVYLYWNEFNYENAVDLSALRNAYQDSAIAVLDSNSYSYRVNFGRKCIEKRDFARAEQCFLPLLRQTHPDTRDYAILTSMVAYLYELKGDYEKQEEFLARSATADIKASVKENISLRQLALCLLGNGDIVHANLYVKKSLEDANFYNARLRNVQIAKILPVIDKAYQMEREMYQKHLLTAITVIGILSLFFALVVISMVLQNRKLSWTRKELLKSNQSLTKANDHLLESNRIKEEYIGQFMDQCLCYIEKLDNYRKSLNKKAARGETGELLQMLKSTDIVEDELKEFYRNFDKTFLYLFPDFVDKFNSLFAEAEFVFPKHSSELSAELRIFALIRLGITDSAKIAHFLHYSITTIYKYRSKFRSKSLVPREKFEEMVMKI